MSYIYGVFEHLCRLWMGIWLPTHTITTTDITPDLWELLKSYLIQVCQPCHYTLVEAVKTFQTASHVHVIHIWEVWAPSQVVDGHMASHSQCYHHRHFPRFVRVGLKAYLMEVCKPCHYALIEAVEPFKLHPMSMTYLYKVFEHFLKVVDGHMASHLSCYHHNHFPRFVKICLNPTFCKCANHATTLWLRL